MFRFVMMLGMMMGASSLWAEVGVLDVRTYGAVGDGKTLCTEAIQKAIDTAHEAGGGTVRFPVGTWLSGTIRLKSHVTLHLDQGATLLGSAKLEHYPEIDPSSVKTRVSLYSKRSLIYAENADRIAIVGEGTIDGNGAAFPRKHDMEIRPFIIRIYGCRDVLEEGITLKGGASWTHHYFACERVRVTGIHVHAFVHHNNDGMNIDNCRDFVLTDSVMHTYDDAICLKSTSDAMTEGVRISNCIASSYASGIKMGTDSTGGFRDVTIVNCQVRPVTQKGGMVRRPVIGLTGVELLLVDGGIMEGVAISNLDIKGYQVPLGVRLGNRGGGYVPDLSVADERKPPGKVRNVSIDNVVIREGGRNVGILLLGHVGHPMENISLSNITFVGPGGGKAETASRVVPEKAEEYPQMAWYGELPGYGLYARHIRGLRLSNIRLETAKPDARHALVLDDVEDANLSGVGVAPAIGDTALMRFTQTRNVLVGGSQPLCPEGTFLDVTGNQSADIALVGNDFTRVGRLFNVAGRGEGASSPVREAGNLGATE